MLRLKIGFTVFRNVLISFLFVNQALAGSFSLPSEELDFAARCESLKSLSIAGLEIDMISVDYLSTADQLLAVNKNANSLTQHFQPYCNVKGYFEKRVGLNDQPYAIGFGIALPADWNGRFLFQGGGGLNGIIREPVGALAAGNIPALFRGFAVVSTDSGHQNKYRFDTSFLEDQQAVLNFISQAVVKTTALAQQVVTEYYGKKPNRSYFVGCSTGGREAMTMSQRYPLLYDGIIAGAPARQTNHSEIAGLWSAKTLRSLINTERTAPFSEGQKQLIIDSLLQQCDAKDGLADGMIFNVQGCDFTPEPLQCKEDMANDNCLAADQASALATAFAGPKYANGENVYPGFFYDTGIAASSDKSVPGLLQAVPAPLGRARIDQPFDMDRELAIANSFPLAPGNATRLNLSSFSGKGSKLMFFHGVSDPWFSAKDTLEYFSAMTASNGGEETVSEWSKLYLVPGMGHCHGGEYALDEFDMLSKLVDWVEKDTAPEDIEVFGQAYPERTRLLCPHPQVTHYRDEGNSELAEAFECR